MCIPQYIRKPIAFVVVSLFCHFAIAQKNIVKAEYYIDKDPGFGNAIPTGNPGDTVMNQVSIAINTALLNTGVHLVGIRVQDANGSWSLNNNWMFIVPAVTVTPKLGRAEYYIDNDPGFGNATAIGTPGDTLMNSISIPINAGILRPGVHTVGIRAQDTNGAWCLDNNWLFIVQPAAVTAKLGRAEYYIDNDPGFGNATAIGTPGDTIMNTISIPINPGILKPGLHTVGVRAQDTNGAWCLDNNWLFIVQPATVIPKLARAEYYIDHDPGFGNATAIGTPGDTVMNNISIAMDPSSLKPGVHLIGIRAQDANGARSFDNNWLFSKPNPSDTSAPANLAAVEFYVDNDPGYGQGTQLPISSMSQISNINLSVNINGLKAGYHVLFLRAKDANGKWGLEDTLAFQNASKILVSGLPSGNQVTLNTGDSLNLSIQFTGTQAGELISSKVNLANLCHAAYTVSNGSSSTFNFRLLGDTCNVGSNVITIIASDTSHPADTAVVSITVNVNRLNQYVSFVPPATKTYNSLPFKLNSTASSGLPTMDSVVSGPAYVRNDSLFITGVGTVTVRTSQQGNNLYNAATFIDQSFCISPGMPGAILGDSAVCANTPASFSVPNIVGANFLWSATGGASLTPTNNLVSIIWPSGGPQTVLVKYNSNCANGDSSSSFKENIITVDPFSGTFTNLFPANNANNLPLPTAFSWFPVAGATNYDLYIWPDTSARPATPLIAGITQISYTLTNSLGLHFGITYKWQVVARKSCYSLESTAQTFSLRFLPNLIVDTVYVPKQASSETEINIGWAIKNIGNGNTDTTWSDAVYVSGIPTFNSANAKLIGVVHNFSALDSGQAYSSPQNFKYLIPIGTQGSLYFFVQTNYGNLLNESSFTDNISVGDSINITLAPPPDLQVAGLSLNPSTTVIAGAPMQINYSVINAGAGPTSVATWNDGFYLSNSPIPDPTKDVLLGYHQHNGIIGPNNNYADSATFNIPLQTYGTKYIYVFTDVNNQVFENLRKDNNTRSSDSITVILNPSPELVVSNVIANSDTFSTGQPATIQWIEKNIGTAVAGPSWYTNIYLSTDTVLDINADSLVGSLPRNLQLLNQSSVTGTLNATIPSNLPGGQYYFIVLSDAGSQLNEHDGVLPETIKQRTGVSLLPIMIVNPDLQPASIVANGTPASGQNINISWQVTNQSRANIYNSSWKDYIYLSPYSQINTEAVIIDSVNMNMFLAANGTYTVQQSINLPRNIAGANYLIINTDAKNTVFESNENNNNLSALINITLSPYADLQPLSIATTDNADTIGTPINLVYSVKNSGTKPVSSQIWNDQVFLSRTGNISDTNLIYLGTVNQNRFLDSSATYTQSCSFPLPLSLTTGSYYPLVFVDAADSIYEYTAENNNKIAGGAINVKPLPFVDLAIQSATIGTSTLNAGQTVPISYSVINSGARTTVVPQWQDAAYLSNDVNLDSTDILLGRWTITNLLSPGSGYSDNVNILIPQSASGAQYILVTTDANNSINDNVRSNNTATLNITGGGNQVFINQPPPADLFIDSLAVPPVATAGQQISVNYTISNMGTGITQSNKWVDKIYLSGDFKLSADDILLDSTVHTDSLGAGLNYTNNRIVSLPNNLNGNYIVICVTDANNNVYEKSGEGNNVAYANLFLNPQLPCDLLPANIQTTPATVIAGKSATFKWTLKNISDNTASGSVRDALYLSKDTVWDANDVLVGFIDGNVNILPKDSISRQLTAIVGVGMGNYYPIVRINILNNLIESNVKNNTGISGATLNVSINQLPFFVSTPDVIQSKIPLYYSLSVPDSLVGKTLLLSINGDSINHASNSLFISKDTLPSADNFDFSAQTPFIANQQVLVPSLLAGNYYITASGQSAAALPNQPVTLLASIVPFSILSVDAKQGGNTGSVTVKLTGSKFEPNMTVMLSGPAQITAANITFVSPILAYATFDLTGQPVGTYTVTAVNSQNTTAQLPNGFSIVQGSAGGAGQTGNGFTCTIENIGYDNNFLIANQPLFSARSNVTSIITISFQNAGNVDIPIQRRIFTSPDSTYINFQPDYSGKLNSLLLECREAGGPTDVLRPGASGFFKIYAMVKGVSHQVIYYYLTQ